mmetsp:Transcript_26587/g.88142  ORF Transcript_26587/g.88142 Transcript_26587/m.88142 type:complete len:202 (-) Transcript_26587:1344-1949(-)
MSIDTNSIVDLKDHPGMSPRLCLRRLSPMRSHSSSRLAPSRLELCRRRHILPLLGGRLYLRPDRRPCRRRRFGRRTLLLLLAGGLRSRPNHRPCRHRRFRHRARLLLGGRPRLRPDRRPRRRSAGSRRASRHHRAARRCCSCRPVHRARPGSLVALLPPRGPLLPSLLRALVRGFAEPCGLQSCCSRPWYQWRRPTRRRPC